MTERMRDSWRKHKDGWIKCGIELRVVGYSRDRGHPDRWAAYKDDVALLVRALDGVEFAAEFKLVRHGKKWIDGLLAGVPATTDSLDAAMGLRRIGKAGD